MEPQNADRIEIGDVTNENDFAKLADCDWVCEAIVERLDIKRDLYSRLKAVTKPTAYIIKYIDHSDQTVG